MIAPDTGACRKRCVSAAIDEKIAKPRFEHSLISISASACNRQLLSQLHATFLPDADWLRVKAAAHLFSAQNPLRGRWPN